MILHYDPGHLASESHYTDGAQVDNLQDSDFAICKNLQRSKII